MQSSLARRILGLVPTVVNSPDAWRVWTSINRKWCRFGFGLAPDYAQGLLHQMGRAGTLFSRQYTQEDRLSAFHHARRTSMQ